MCRNPSLLSERLELGYISHRIKLTGYLCGEERKTKETRLVKVVKQGQAHLPITHQDHDLMNRLRVLREVVPEVGRVIGTGQVSFRVSLLGVDKVRELCRVSQEEDGSVVGDPVKVAFGRPELDGKTSRVTS